MLQPYAAKAEIILTVSADSEVTGAALRGLPLGITGLEIRADVLGAVAARELRRHFSGQLIYTRRARPSEPAEARHEHLIRAARDYDVVNLESPHDLTPRLLAAIPADRRWISWHGPAQSVSRLGERFREMARVPARRYLLEPRAVSFQEALEPLRLLKLLGRGDVSAFAGGRLGGWSRVLAPWLGAPVVFTDTSAVDQTLLDYGFPDLLPLDSLYGIASPSTSTSLFTRLMNADYRAQAMGVLFLPFTLPDPPGFLAGSWLGAATEGFDELGLPLLGLTVAAPYKDAALSVARTAGPQADAARAANLLVRRSGGWRAETTDGTAVIAALGGREAVRDRRVAVIGCGGAGRAAAASLKIAGAEVTLVNRGSARARYAAELLGLPAVPLASFDPAGYAVIVHATPTRDEPPFDPDLLTGDTIVLDFICAAEPTALVAAATDRGFRAISGREVLAAEAVQQFRLMTGRHMRWQPESTRRTTNAVSQPLA